ncbi:hypothetical protein C0992_010967, partial [Termitomyces sp. T32_za158]
GTSDPVDLDLYVPNGEWRKVLHQLVHDYGYTVDPDPLDNAYSRVTGIYHVVRYCRGACVVDLVVSMTDDSVVPIINFHSTLIMNYMSGTNIVCAYPDLTFNRRGLVNSRRLILSELDYDIISPLIKYRRRGFDLAVTLEEWEEYGKHVCGSDPNCPGTTRSFNDSHTFTVNLGSILDLVDSPRSRVVDTLIAWTLCSV